MQTDNKNILIGPVKRVSAHRTDTRAVREVEAQLSTDWIVRHTQERDYGIDLMVEIFDGDAPTGGLVLLQIKGTEDAFGSSVKLHKFPVKTLLYAQMFTAPFFLFHVSITDKKIYYVWLQKYIKTRLPLDTPKWRTQDTVTIYFPENNVLSTGLNRIAKLASNSVHRDLGITFLINYEWLVRLINNETTLDQGFINNILAHVAEISNLTSFLETYLTWTDEIDLIHFKRIFEKARQYELTELEEEDQIFIDLQMDQLLSIKTMFLSEDETDAFIVENSSHSEPY